MIVKSLELDFFRNYVHLEAVFDPRVNLIYGDNAQGKTNLLEAVAYLSTARSHRARYDREMIMLGVDGAFVKGEVRSLSLIHISTAISISRTTTAETAFKNSPSIRDTSLYRSKMGQPRTSSLL